MSKNTYKISLFREGALVSESVGFNVATAEASRAASFATGSGSAVSSVHTFPRTNYCEVYERVLPKDQKFGGRVSNGGTTTSPPADRLGFSSTNLEGVASEEVIEGRRFILRKSKFEIPITRTGKGLTFLISGGISGNDGLANGSGNSKHFIFEPQDPLDLLNGDTVVVEHSAYYDVEDSWDPAMGGDPLWFQEIGSGVATISVSDVDGVPVRVEKIPYSLRIPIVGVRSSDSSATWLFGGRDGRRNLRSIGPNGGNQFVRALGSSGDVELRDLRPGTSLNPAPRLPLIDFDLGEGDRRHVFPTFGGSADSRLVTSTLADFTVVSPASEEVSFHALSFTLVNAFGSPIGYPWVRIPFSGHTVDDLFSLSASDGLAMTTPLPTENRILLTAILSFGEEIEVSAEESFRLSIPVRLTVPPSDDVKAAYPGYVQWGPSPPEGATLLTGGLLDPTGLGDPSWDVSGGGEVASSNGGPTGFFARVRGAGEVSREIPFTGGSAAMFRARVSSSFGYGLGGSIHEVVLEAKGPSGELLESTELLVGSPISTQGSDLDVGVVLGDISIPEGTASLVFRLSSTGGNLWARNIELWIEP